MKLLKFTTVARGGQRSLVANQPMPQDEHKKALNRARSFTRRGLKPPMEKIYATVSDDSDCLTFREIASKMTDRGDAMNHASARNHVLRAMRKFAQALAVHQGVTLSEFEVEARATDPDFQAAMGRLLQDYYATGMHLAADI